MKNIYCIVGPSGCGKTTLVEALTKKFGFKAVESYTTRPQRYEGEKGHLFVLPEEFKSLGEMYAYVKFNGYEYGVTADLIEQNDLYVIEPSGVEFLREKYNGSKGVKVIGLTADTDVLIERMAARGDSDEKIVERLANDADVFKNFENITDIVLRSDINSINELCDAVQWHIYNFEYWCKHDFSLLNEKGEVVNSSERQYYDVDEATEGLRRLYPDGLPEGWAVRDDTEVARSKYLKAIKKLKPSFKSSMINIHMENAGTSRDGYTAVAFKYKGKEYYYRSYNGDEWITEKENRLAPLSAGECLNNEIVFLKKEIDKIDTKLDKEYRFYGLEDIADLKNKKERFKKAVGFLENALQLVKKEVVKEPADLDSVIKKAAEHKDSSVSKQGLIDKNIGR